MGKKRHGKRLPQVVRTEQDIRDLMQAEFSHFLSDIEYRLKQTYEVQRRTISAAEHRLSDKSIERLSDAGVPVMAEGTVYAEDLNLMIPMLTGYTVTNNTPAGAITWASVHIVYGGIDYAIADGACAATDYYMWFDLSTATAPVGNNSTATMQKSLVSNKPTLDTGDAIVFLNNAGTPVKVMEMNIPPVVANGAVDTGALQANAVTGAKVATGANGLTGANLTSTAGISGGQLSATAGITGGQLSGSANIAGTQLSPTANLVGSQLTAGTVGSTQLGTGAVSASKLSVLDHIIY